MKTKRPILQSLALAALMMSVASAADIGVGPPRLDVVLPPGGSATEILTVVWTGKSAVDIAVSQGDWSLSETGNIQFMPVGQGQYSASSWVRADASTLSFSGPGQQDVRLAITVPNDPKVRGTYQTVVFFTTPGSKPSGAGAQVSFQQRVGAIVYVTVAGTERNGSSLQDLFVDQGKIHAVISNSGNTLMRYSGSLEVRDASGKTVSTVPISDGAVLRESQRDVAIDMPKLSPGYYVFLLLLKDSRGGLLSGQLPYEVK